MRFTELDGKNVGIWGYGREGRAAVKAMRRHAPAARLTAVADKPFDEATRAELSAADVAVGSGDPVDVLGSCEIVIRSPGVSKYRADVAELATSGVKFTTGSNIWFAQHPDATVIAVTGTKGKSTTTSLISHLLSDQGRATVLAGNIGVPLLDVVDSEPDVWVFELSSHQLSDLQYSPTVAVVTNLYREHLDWHGSEEIYFGDKLRILHNSSDVIAVLNHQNEELVRRSDGLRDIRWFGEGGRFHVIDDDVYDGKELLYQSNAIPLLGRHNRLNVCAALTAISAVGADPRMCAAALGTFQALPHRLQTVGIFDGVRFVDDSIATTPEATLAGLDAFGDQKVALLLGGFERDQDYNKLVASVVTRSNVIGVITMPDNGGRIFDLFSAAATATSPTLFRSDDLDEAVRRAAALVSDGGVVLLSPAAPSYGRFKNFEERGDAFAAAARKIAAVS